MTDISDINWHDSVIIKIIEIPTDSRLIFEVNYPIDWELHKYEIHCIEFMDIYQYQIYEGPFAGAITILDLEIQEIADEYDAITYKMDTNAGYRTIKCKKFDLKKGRFEG
jgi:hypothetical protein